eukprot:TRINITY_DN81363_c0_g1_i1.p1 TRINITY_DN81363_c0_g1~~TRINITY_DN81363_c0_g1_i1.p1  ORF type:complete len:313 (-),score=45.79 TRINITY_DN81363_c0_g1_i1:25-963(-)
MVPNATILLLRLLVAVELAAAVTLRTASSHGLYRASDASNGSVAGCTEAAECSACTSTPGCGWCGVERRCVPGGKLGPSATTCIAYDYSRCIAVTCTSRTTCGECRADPSCGWCATTQQCLDGGSTGPLGAGGAVTSCAAWVHAGLRQTSCDAPAAAFNGLLDAIVPMEQASSARMKELEAKAQATAEAWRLNLTYRTAAEARVIADAEVAAWKMTSTTPKTMEEKVREVVATLTSSTTTATTVTTEPLERVVLRVLRTSTHTPPQAQAGVLQTNTDAPAEAQGGVLQTSTNAPPQAQDRPWWRTAWDSLTS